MEKFWQVLPQIEGDFIKTYPEYSRVVLQLLKNRDLIEKIEIEEFLDPDYEGYSHDSFLFNQMEEAIDLIIKHIKSQNKIVIYGDYDVDGVTSSVVLYEILTLFKAKTQSYIPDRVREGYGLNKEAIEEIAKDGAKLLITVDCGIVNGEEIKYAQELGLEVILTDHHTPPENKDDLPKSIILNPHVEGENYPFKYLAGVGVAFKLASALIQKSKLTEDEKQILEERLLDLVAIGTIGDLVSLTGENRILVKKGLEALNKTKRVGLLELMKIAQINNGKKLDAWNVGFQIAPRLNAAGRMDLASRSFDLLVSKDEKEAKKSAEYLNQINIERQMATEEMMAAVEKDIKGNDDKIIISICSNEKEMWNEGVIGLAAGRITEKYYRPTLIITRTDSGDYKGSGRGIEEFNVIEAVRECGDLLEKYGGHPMACGFSVLEENLEKFVTKMKEIAEKKLGNQELKPKIIIDAELDVHEIGEDLFADIQKFTPFGKDNFKPKFVSRNIQIKDIMTMGADGQHIKFRINGIWALSFGGTAEWGDFKIGDSVDMVYYIDKNEFNGNSEIQLKVVDMKSHNS